MKTASAYIVYDPLSLTFSVQVIGGALTQRKDALTGEFDPDRTMFPLMFQPNLMVKDPEHILPDGDHTTKLIDCKWYIGSSDKGTLIDATTPGLTLGEYGRLVVTRNIEPSSPLTLFFSCGYIDSRNNKTFRKSAMFTLDSTLVTEVNLGVEIDAAANMPISPFKKHQNRTINATFRNGQDVIPDAKAKFVWMVHDVTTRTMRPITADDLFYVSGQGTKSLTIDRRYIDKELIEVHASLKSLPEKVVKAHTKMYRWYGYWEESERITRGKYIRTDTKEIEVQAVVNNSKGTILNPTEFFDITHYQTGKYVGAPIKEIGVGEKVVVPRSSVGSDPNAQPVFGCEVYERSALRPCQIGGQNLLIDGKVMCIQVPIKGK